MIDEFIQILLPLPFAQGFDYRIPAGLEVRPGDYVRVPFGRKSLFGVVWGKAAGGIDPAKIKTIETHAAHLPPMADDMRAFLEWVSWYTLAPLGAVLKMALSSPDALEPPKLEPRYLLAETLKPTPARLRIVAYLADATPRTAKEITLHAKVSPAVLREFIKAGGLQEAASKQLPAVKTETFLPRATHLPLSPDQQSAADALCNKIGAGFSVTLLDGVTGSGKTEVYFAAIERALTEGKQALVLLPEIALSVQFLSRFEKRFGFAPDLWHSSVSAARKRETWRGVASGSVRVVVGARSALFLPFAALGMLVADEEHDASYKQEDGVIYHARDMAVARSHREKIPAVLVSATPSLETEFNIEHKRYARLHLPDRHGGAEMPRIHLIDMRGQKMPASQWISEPFRAALIATLAKGQQAMLFINRRGYAPLMLCRACGHRFQCPHCTSWLVVHRGRSKLVCHHCNFTTPVPTACPECKTEKSLVPYGPGVERVAEEVRALFPQARIEVMTSDESQSPAALIDNMTHGKIDILVGTQMIAKGHHFAGLALVGVIDGDMGLAGGDLRAAERTYQLLHQLSGRAGREKTPGEVWLQTYLPTHPVMQALAAGERDPFMALEARMREEAGMPPYGKLASVIVEGKNEQEVIAFARELVKTNALKPINPLTPNPLVLGPAPAPLARLGDRHRWRILVKTHRTFPLQQWLSNWLLTRKTPTSLRLKIDVDPYSFI